jgi:hypothetical protein
MYLTAEREDSVLNETTAQRTYNRINNREVRTMVSAEVFAALCKYKNDHGSSQNWISRYAITKFLREEGYLRSAKIEPEIEPEED